MTRSIDPSRYLTEGTLVDAAVVADLAERAAVTEHGVETIAITEDRSLVRLLRREGDRTVETLLDPDVYGAQPRFKSGQVQTSTIGSFVRYVGKHKEPGTEVWVDIDAGRFVAVIDDHRVGPDSEAFELGGWGDHRATCTLKPTTDWLHWLSQDGKLLPQLAFAEHVEQGLHNITTPAAAEFLEIAQTLSGSRNVLWKSVTRIDNGQIGLRYEENVQGRAGAAEELEIPQQFVITLEPFEGAPPVSIYASFRWRLNDGVVSLGYRLQRPDVARRAAIDLLIDEVEHPENGLDLQVLLGTPRAPRTPR